MDFSQIFLLVALTLLFLVNDSMQFLVANCVWDEALSGAPLGDLRGFVLSDADACALFCSKPGAGVVVSGTVDAQSATGSSNAALCDRCCKSSQPPSKPGELLVSILHTLIKAFGPSQTPQTQIKPDTGPEGNVAPSAKPSTEESPADKPHHPDQDEGPHFDSGDAGQNVNLGDDRRSRPGRLVDHFNQQNFDRGPSTAEPRRNRAYPEARIFEITGRDDGPSFRGGFDLATDRGPGWPQPADDFPLKSGTIR